MIGSVRPAFVGAMAWIALAAPMSATLEQAAAADRSASWNPMVPVFASDVTPADRAGATLSINDVLAVLHRAPSLAAPTGFRVVPHAHVSMESPDHVADSPRPRFVAADIQLNVAPLEWTARGAAIDEDNTALEVEVLINDLQPVEGTRMGDQSHDWQDGEGSFVQDPAASSETRHGFPVFEAGNLRTWVVIRRNDVPFYAPVSRERYLRLFIRYAEEERSTLQSRRGRILANLPAMAAALDEQLATLDRKVSAAKVMYAAMSSDDRQQPARLIANGGADRPPAFASTESDEATPVVVLNPALMDSRLSRAVPQVLAIEISSRTDRGRELGDRLEEEIDWPALAGIVRQNR